MKSRNSTGKTGLIDPEETNLFELKNKVKREEPKASQATIDGCVESQKEGGKRCR